MCFWIYSKVPLSPDATKFFAVFFYFPFTFNGDLQLSGIDHQMGELNPGGRFKTDIFADTGVIRVA